MGYPWGKAPLADGTGTTPTDMQRILGAQYVSSGLLPNGGLTVEGTSSMAYKVNAGAAFMWFGYESRLGALVPVEETIVNTLPAPSTGSRTDTVYVDGDGGVQVITGTSIPGGVAIARFTVPAGITATTSAIQSIDRRFAIATGASLGRLGYYKHPSATTGATSEATLYTGRFNLPSDRIIRVDANVTIKSATSTPGVANFAVEFGAGGSKRTMMCAHTPTWNTFGCSWSFVASEGANTFSFRSIPYSGGNWQYAYSSDVATEFTIWDGGVSQ